jgi:N-acetyl-D-muramate 6-phosphate phosphatase
MSRAFEAVLFDLDGTLVDSAPDLAGTANELRVSRGLSELPLEALRPMVGMGARGMVGVSLGLGPEDAGFVDARDEFLLRYEQRLAVLTHVFPAMAEVIDVLDRAGLRWGIVTNKAERFALPLVRTLGLSARSAVTICGDTTPHAKPHPEPLLEAARRLALSPAACLYVGDDLRDVQAGRAAGMSTAAAAWGYLGVGESIDAWGADHLLESPEELLNLLRMA